MQVIFLSVTCFLCHLFFYPRATIHPTLNPSQAPAPLAVAALVSQTGKRKDQVPTWGLA
jgi:hypothetical protein